MSEGAAVPTVPRAEMEALEQGFRDANDAKLRRVTRLIDRMPNRGDADALLAPVRNRLATLRPVRNMNRNRLLFTPFDPLLVSPERWQPGSFLLPRSVLAPVIALLDGPQGATLPQPPPFDAADPLELLRCGRPLWNAAAVALTGASMPTGADRQPLAELLPAMAMVFRSADALRSLPPPHDPALDLAVLSLLNQAVRVGPAGWGIMLTLLLDTVPADLVARIAGTIARNEHGAAQLRSGIDQAVVQFLAQLEQAAQPPRGGPAENEPALLLRQLDTMRRLAGVRQLENRPSFEQKRVLRLEQALDSASEAMLQRSLRLQFDRFEQIVSADMPESPALLDRIEADARRLLSFAAGASALRGDRTFLAMVDEATTRFVATGGNAGGGRTGVARLRLMELLCGSERALQIAARRRTGSNAP